jgi:S-DNA-T family DNA segregation ATPase FtsK/SpoIIIE
MATTAVRTERLKLGLAVSAPGSEPAPVELDAPADTSVGAVIEALAHAVDVEADDVVLERTGRRLPREADLAEVGLRHGDSLVLDGAPSRRGPGPPVDFEVAVVGGPAAGTRFPLAPGTHLLGRDETWAFSIDDPALSSRHLRLRLAEDGGLTVEDLGSRNGTRVEGAALAARAGL